MSEQMKCPYNAARCICRDCKSNAVYDDCESGYCINCYECEQAEKAVHDIYVCTGYEKRVISA